MTSPSCSGRPGAVLASGELLVRPLSWGTRTRGSCGGAGRPLRTPAGRGARSAPAARRSGCAAGAGALPLRSLFPARSRSCCLPRVPGPLRASWRATPRPPPRPGVAVLAASCVRGAPPPGRQVPATFSCLLRTYLSCVLMWTVKKRNFTGEHW